ncbi:chromatin remodeling factor [Aureococcus anophagefferens]|nr:chromatin remodeling factor [Aureococcus anophagefferens]
MLRRTKADVLRAALPGKRELVVRVELSAPQKALYRAVLTKNYDALAAEDRGRGGGAPPNLQNVVIQLRKVCDHCELMYDHFPDVCDGLAARADPALPPRLGALLAGGGKLALLDAMLLKLKARGHRVLVFSQMTKMLDVLGEYCALRQFAYERLDGDTAARDRARRIDRFNAAAADRAFLFLLSTRSGGLGVNLATANTVVIYDADWNPHNDLQALARAHRLGQTDRVLVYRLVCRATVESASSRSSSRRATATARASSPGAPPSTLLDRAADDGGGDDGDRGGGGGGGKLAALMDSFKVAEIAFEPEPPRRRWRRRGASGARAASAGRGARGRGARGRALRLGRALRDGRDAALARTFAATGRGSAAAPVAGLHGPGGGVDDGDGGGGDDDDDDDDDVDFGARRPARPGRAAAGQGRAEDGALRAARRRGDFERSTLRPRGPRRARRRGDAGLCRAVALECRARPRRRQPPADGDPRAALFALVERSSPRSRAAAPAASTSPASTPRGGATGPGRRGRRRVDDGARRGSSRSAATPRKWLAMAEDDAFDLFGAAAAEVEAARGAAAAAPRRPRRPRRATSPTVKQRRRLEWASSRSAARRRRRRPAAAAAAAARASPRPSTPPPRPPSRRAAAAVGLEAPWRDGDGSARARTARIDEPPEPHVRHFCAEARLGPYDSRAAGRRWEGARRAYAASAPARRRGVFSCQTPEMLRLRLAKDLRVGRRGAATAGGAGAARVDVDQGAACGRGGAVRAVRARWRAGRRAPAGGARPARAPAGGARGGPRRRHALQFGAGSFSRCLGPAGVGGGGRSFAAPVMQQ